MRLGRRTLVWSTTSSFPLTSRTRNCNCSTRPLGSTCTIVLANGGRCAPSEPSTLKPPKVRYSLELLNPTHRFRSTHETIEFVVPNFVLLGFVEYSIVRLEDSLCRWLIGTGSILTCTHIRFVFFLRFWSIGRIGGAGRPCATAKLRWPHS